MNDLSRVREKVRDLIDEFSNAYLSARVNPRPTGGPYESKHPDRRGVRARRSLDKVSRLASVARVSHS